MVEILCFCYVKIRLVCGNFLVYEKNSNARQVKRVNVQRRDFGLCVKLGALAVSKFWHKVSLLFWIII